MDDSLHFFFPFPFFFFPFFFFLFPFSFFLSFFVFFFCELPLSFLFACFHLSSCVLESLDSSSSSSKGRTTPRLRHATHGFFFLKRPESSFNGFHDASIPGARATVSMCFATVRRAAFAPPRAFSVVREAVSNRFADDVSRVTLVRVILGTPVL